MATLGAALPPIASPLVPRSARRRSRRGVILGGAGAALALGFFITSALQAGSVYYLTVGELEQKGAAAYGERVRVAAKVLGGTIQRDAGQVRFTIVDDPSLGTVKQPGLLERFVPQPSDQSAPAPISGSAAAAAAAGGRQLQVAYRGVVPDVFGPDVDVVVEGKLTPAGTFEATSLLAKCPSRYEAK